MWYLYINCKGEVYRLTEANFGNQYISIRIKHFYFCVTVWVRVRIIFNYRSKEISVARFKKITCGSPLPPPSPKIFWDVQTVSDMFFLWAVSYNYLCICTVVVVKLIDYHDADPSWCSNASRALSATRLAPTPGWNVTAPPTRLSRWSAARRVWPTSRVSLELG